MAELESKGGGAVARLWTGARPCNVPPELKGKGEPVRRGRWKFGGLVLCLLVLGPAALADGSSKGYGAGGRFARYYPVIRKYNRNGERFRIVGFCRSACTLFLSIKNVCIERGAFLSFHAGPDARTGKWGPNASSTKKMLRAYKPALRRYLVDGHHVHSRKYFTMKGATLIDKFGYRECPPPIPALPVKRDRF